MPFEDGQFDLVWAEGSISAVGFERALYDWKRLIKPEGFMVMHDEAGDVEAKMHLIEEHGYHLLHHFLIHENIWWDEYYTQLNEQIGEHYLDGGLPFEGMALEVFKEIEMYRSSPEKFRSAYFIMQKA
jgi:SAM-dependent methyltransferase